MTEPRTGRTARGDQPGAGLSFGGRYTADQELAVGGAGTVYAGRDTLLQRPVAIKVLHPEPGREPQNEFLREARAAAALKHPNIVDVYDAGIEGERPYIVMEYVPGETLRELIAREGPLPPARAAALAAEVADALDYAHRRGVVHCDVKPGNILLPAEDQPKVVDFGIATNTAVVGNAGEEIAGTAPYIAPEQIDGRPLDGRTDVYSLTAVLFEMLTGRPPFEARSLAEAARQRTARTPEAIAQRIAATPADLKAIVVCGLQVDPDHRFGSAADLAAELRQFSEGMTRRVTRRLERDGTAAEPRTTAVRRAGVAVALDEPRRSRSPWPWIAAIGALLLAAVLGGTALATGVIGGGSNTVIMPGVVNQRIDAAAEQIRGTGLKVASPVDLVKNDAPFGTVLRQEPEPGATLKKKTDVRLTVSLGP
ncbi:MAG: serine/threonine protein kinase [Chloroflexi bacterium]|nr:serine/threonine protein kinase [Chloroflexota bacterium]